MTAVNLSRAELRRLVDAGDVDTVIVAFADMQGRLMGKRVTGHFWLEQNASKPSKWGKFARKGHDVA